jgi:hypothetical protein
LSDGFEEQWKDVDSFIEMGRIALGVLPEEESTKSEVGGMDKEKEWSDDGSNGDEEPVPPRPVAPPCPVRSSAPEVGDEQDVEEDEEED